MRGVRNPETWVVSRGCQLLKKWRGDRQQSEVCILLDFDRATYSRIECGSLPPGGNRAWRIHDRTKGAVPVESWRKQPLGAPVSAGRGRAA